MINFYDIKKKGVRVNDKACELASILRGMVVRALRLPGENLRSGFFMNA